MDLALRGIAQRRAGLDAEEARWLREAEALKIWRPLGMANAIDYMERVLGYAPRAAQERLRVAQALGELPVLTDALSRGRLSFSAVRELSRIAKPHTEAAWAQAADGKNLREIETLVAGRRPGDLPTDLPDPEVRTHVVRFELSAETFAVLRQARSVLDSEHGTNLTDDAFIATLASGVLDGVASGATCEPSFSSERISEVGNGTRAGSDDDDLFVVAGDRMDELSDDAAGDRTDDRSHDTVGDRTEDRSQDTVGDRTEERSHDSSSQTGSGTTAVGFRRSPATASSGASLDHRATSGRARFQIGLTVCTRCRAGWQHGAGAMIPISAEAVERAECDAQHLGSIDAEVPQRAYQDISPAVARLVWLRDEGRCQTPGCRSSRGLEIHHVVPRSEGGHHGPSNLRVHCSACHKAQHLGTLAITGTRERMEVLRPAESLASAHTQASHLETGPFHDEDRSAPASPADTHIENHVPEARARTAIDLAIVRAQAKDALVGMGWKPGIARAAVDEAIAAVGICVELEGLIREALRRCPKPTSRES